MPHDMIQPKRQQYYDAEVRLRLLYDMIGRYMIQDPCFKLDKDFSRHIEIAAEELYKALLELQYKQQ
jgi:hypothetical protein